MKRRDYFAVCVCSLFLGTKISAGSTADKLSYSFILYFDRSGPFGPTGRADFSSSQTGAGREITAAVAFPWTVQRMASLIPMPCPSIHKQYTFRETDSTSLYTNGNGTFFIARGQQTLFGLAVDLIGRYTTGQILHDRYQEVVSDVFITCDDCIGENDEGIQSREGTFFARVIRDMEVTFHGTHAFQGDKYLLVRAAPKEGLIPVMHTPFFDIGLIAAAGFLRSDGFCPWVHLSIENYFDISGTAESLYEKHISTAPLADIFRRECAR